MRRPAPVDRPGSVRLEPPFDRVEKRDDLAFAGDAHDDVRPESGDGGSDNDNLDGGANDDELYGDAGPNVIIGGPGDGRDVVDCWSTRVASVRTADILIVRRAAEPSALAPSESPPARTRWGRDPA